MDDLFKTEPAAPLAESLRPKTIAELASVPGVGSTKLERYGRDVLDALALAS